jgi:thiosulfate/3-mercaptopyruvate sulfurtransferase
MPDAREINLMGCNSTCIKRLHKAAGFTLILSLLGAMFLSFLANTALAGTETGEFCPTCPDWTNLDGWLAKRDAYERQQMEAMQAGSQIVSKSPEQPKAVVPPKRYPKQEMLISASAIGDRLVIVDSRAPQEFNAGHISGARNLFWKDMQKAGLLDVASAQIMLCTAGINNSDHILLYGNGDEGAFFAFWALKYLGHKNISILDGGVDAAWKAGQKPAVDLPVFRSSNYTANVNPELLVASGNLENFLNRSDIEILDARDFVDYGRSKLTNSSIPLSADKLFEDSMMKDVKTMEDLLNRRDLDKRGTQLVYGTPQAYSLFFGLTLMGYNATLLEGDWWQRTKWAVNNIR